MLQEKYLVLKLNLGDRTVWHRIYERHKDQLVTLATALLYDKTAAEDVVHDVFASLIQSAARLRITTSLKGYLARSVANSARNRNKAGQIRRTSDISEAEPVESPQDRPDHSTIFGEQSGKLAGAMAVLPYEQREVLMLHHHSGMKFREIAEAQGISINTVQGRYRYGLDKLRSILNGEVTK
jgi:RNA polymerase sigma-70 factor (ECF subfamily)